MNNVSVRWNHPAGRVKPMHAVNNGPVYKFQADQRLTNMEDYKAAGIPYARNHDASFFATYGGNHTVDVSFIFSDFDADPYDEASYDFACTDQYVKVTELSGAETFYRLGSRIEHEIKKYNTLPPKDFHKWAVICEHIIRHYTEGWANGFHYQMTYWEIWNEPDLDTDDSANKRCWGGTAKQFYELYKVTASHLKRCFPQLKIGGPALAGQFGDWLDGFLQALTADGERTPLDFFSWHIYARQTDAIRQRAVLVREKLDRFGYTQTESILNEWNYVKGWENDDFLYSIRAISSLKGAAFTASAMLMGQYLPIDMLMYYDARPSGFNGLWAPYTYDKLKGYYPFYAFNILYRLGDCVQAETDSENLYVCAAQNDREAAVMIAHYDDEDHPNGAGFHLAMEGWEAAKTVKIYLLDDAHDLALVAAGGMELLEKPVQLGHNCTLLIRLEK